MGVIFEEMDYVRVVEGDPDHEQVPRRYDYNSHHVNAGSEYVLRRGVDYWLIFPLSCFLVVSLKFERAPGVPRPNATVRRIFQDTFPDGQRPREHRLFQATPASIRGALTQHEDCVVFSGEHFNVVGLTFDCDYDDSAPYGVINGSGDSYDLRVEADVGLDYHVSKLIRFRVRSD
jgi:hypothetical protein